MIEHLFHHLKPLGFLNMRKMFKNLDRTVLVVYAVLMDNNTCPLDTLADQFIMVIIGGAGSACYGPYDATTAVRFQRENGEQWTAVPLYKAHGF